MSNIEKKRFAIAYIQRLVYPSPTAAAQQSILMANALANQGGDVTFFVHDLLEPAERIDEQYGINKSQLKIFPLRTRNWPRWIYNNSYMRFLAFNLSIMGVLSFAQDWRRSCDQLSILFVRSRLEFLFWGLIRPFLFWMRNWIFIYEAHDLLYDKKATERHIEQTKQALKNYDLVIALTHALANDICKLTGGKVQASVLPLATAISRSSGPSETDHFLTKNREEEIILGYLGTIDKAHGVEDAIGALNWLSKDYKLRMRGRLEDGNIAGAKQFKEMHDQITLLSPVDYASVASEIDACDIVLAPSGDSTHSERYRSPLKIFDYMARGKPIIAANVSAHLELLQDRVNALLYKPGQPKHLAEQVMLLIENPELARRIARTAWLQSEGYTYEVRAERILDLAMGTKEQKQVRDLNHA